MSQTPPRPGTLSCAQRLKSALWTVFYHVRKHAGVGLVCSVAYFDPGNWGVDLQAGSQFGYRLLFVVLLAGLFAVFLQVLAARLGCVTGMDLACHCRLLLHDRPNHPLLYRWLLLYPLYILSEIAIISTDLAELLGSAIALCMLFPKLPLWAGVLLTAFDVLFVLALGNPLRGRPVRVFELIIAVLVLSVLICMAIIIAKIGVNWADAFQGFIPSKYLFKSGGLYTSVGILGATVMPHSLFLGSALATQDRLKLTPSEESLSKEPLDPDTQSPSRRTWDTLRVYIKSAFLVVPTNPDKPKRHSEHENNTLSFVRAHLYHGVADVAISLLGFAVLINSLILILAGAVFYDGHSSAVPASLFDAHDLIRTHVGKPAALLFALALLSSGQSSSLIATVAGQAVSEGFLQWKTSPVVRRLITRLLGLIPSMVVAIAVGRPGIDTLLVASQVVLSIVLPFITFPLLYFTSSKSFMSVRRPRTTRVEVNTAVAGGDTETAMESVDFSNNKITILTGALIWMIILVANMYVIVTLAMGQTG